MEEINLPKLINHLVNHIHPKCQKCRDTATRHAYYVLIMTEQYFCDHHTHQDLDHRWCHFTTTEVNYVDLPHAESIRQAKRYLASC